MKPSLILFVTMLTVASCKNNKSASTPPPPPAPTSGAPGTGNGGVGITLPVNPTPAPDKPDKGDEKNMQKQNPVREIQVVPGMKLSKSNPFSFGSVLVQGDSLLIAVQYSGGCKEHEWNLYTTGTYSKTYPPKLELHLHHNSNEDYCKAMIRETLIFDLKKIRYEGSKAVELQLYDFVDFVTYTY